MVTVVVPLDGSEFAEQALRPACAFASRMDDARVLLVSCAADDTAAVHAHLADRAGLFAAVVDVETRVVHDAEPAEAILRTVVSEPDGLLCMATHGRGGLRTAVLGSVAEEIICRCSEPLILVGPAARTALLPGERGRLLICSDGSPFSDHVIPAAASWGARLELEPWVAEVIAPDEEVVPRGQVVRNRDAEAASDRLDQLAIRTGFPRSAVRTKVLHGVPVSRSISAFADRLPASLIAMATHGRAGLARTAMASVAAEVVRHAPCPVLISRPTMTAE